MSVVCLSVCLSVTSPGRFSVDFNEILYGRLRPGNYGSKSDPILYFRLVLQDFGSKIWPFFENPAKSGSGQIYSRIWRIVVQLRYVQLIRIKLTQPICHVMYSQFFTTFYLITFYLITCKSDEVMPY